MSLVDGGVNIPSAFFISTSEENKKNTPDLLESNMQDNQLTCSPAHQLKCRQLKEFLLFSPPTPEGESSHHPNEIAGGGSPSGVRGKRWQLKLTKLLINSPMRLNNTMKHLSKKLQTTK